MALTDSVPISGGDYGNSGAASRRIKECLRKIGASAQLVRRAMIATYEAEMNVVVHASSGLVRYAVGPERLDVVTTDRGPGIPDIPQAMTEGFSTASSEARALGFGAGMGLPSIQRTVDAFEIRSDPGRGTFVRFSIALKAEEAGATEPTSVAVKGPCRRCMRCVVACPTGAMRLRGSEPEILRHLCIDCTACIDVCPDRGLGIAVSNDPLLALKDADVVVPHAFVAQFGPGVSYDDVEGALRSLGARRVHALEHWESALHAEALVWAAAHGIRSCLVPACPAAVNLIASRYPSLTGQVAPFLTPVEAALHFLWGHRSTVVALCPAMCTAASLSGAEAVSATALYGAIERHVHGTSGQGQCANPRAASPAVAPPESRVVEGPINVAAELERLERTEFPETRVVELHACSGGCARSPLIVGRPLLPGVRIPPRLPSSEARAVRRKEPYTPRGGVRLGGDMETAIRTLGRISELARRLPGHDCSACGAPSCSALAEDVVLGRSVASSCVHWNGNEEST